MNIAILGYGVVGRAAAQVLLTEGARIEAELGLSLNLKWVLNRSSLEDSAVSHLAARSLEEILDDSSVDIVIETIGGITDAYDYTIASLRASKHVVSSNKEVVARYGPEILNLAAEQSVFYLYEAAVGGGMPLLRSLREDLAANRILSLTAILNGTSNYILEQMESQNEEFSLALEEAQTLGYAEADPSSDIGGMDSTRKLAILASRITRCYIAADQIHSSGIEAVRLEHIQFAQAHSGRIKLIARMERKGEDQIALTHAAFFVPNSHPLYHINGVQNAAVLKTSAAGEIIYAGPGAGGLATASSVVSDLIQIGRWYGAGQGRALSIPERWQRDEEAIYLADQDIGVRAYCFPLTKLAAEQLSELAKQEDSIVERLNTEIAVCKLGDQKTITEADLDAFLLAEGLKDAVFILRLL